MSRFGLAIGAAVLSAALSSRAAFADSRWQSRHPRREELNGRLGRQDSRIRQEVREGEMSRGQAASLHRDDRQIRQEERDMASQDGSHVTRREDQSLNRQENEVSRQIGR